MHPLDTPWFQTRGRKRKGGGGGAEGGGGGGGVILDTGLSARGSWFQVRV